MPFSNARNSASVSAARGVTMRSIGGSSARFRNSAVRPSRPDFEKRSRKYAAVSCDTPRATNTTANASLSSDSRAWSAIWEASWSCGRPAPEKIGSFWPRTRVFSPSTAEIPVTITSCG